MTEKERTISLFEKLYNGSPWIDISIKPTLENTSHEQASTKYSPRCNSIWEIVNHLIAWRRNVLSRLQGEIIRTPDNNYFEPIADTSQKAWEDTLKRYDHVQNQWIDFLKDFDIRLFDEEYPPNKMTYFEHIQGILQHDAYHLGQIVLLSKQILKVKP